MFVEQKGGFKVFKLVCSSTRYLMSGKLLNNTSSVCYRKSRLNLVGNLRFCNLYGFIYGKTCQVYETMLQRKLDEPLQEHVSLSNSLDLWTAAYLITDQNRVTMNTHIARYPVPGRC